jgi:alkenylglycerophosphocholine/alkenylglycerophosphoethanolamine hydrolase
MHSLGGFGKGGGMLLVILGAVFWVFASISIILRAVAEDKIRKEMVAVLKMIPALSGVVLVLTVPPAIFLFHYLLAASLIFCALGDAAMEYDVLPGLGLFLFAHIIFVVNFVWLTTYFGLTLIPLIAFATCLGGMLFYTFIYRRYLMTAESPVPKTMLTAVTVYAIAISLTLCTSLLLWLTVAEMEIGWILFMGSLLFVASDSVIGISVFHHHMREEGVIILTTYYLAIFLIALSALVYVI